VDVDNAELVVLLNFDSVVEVLGANFCVGAESAAMNLKHLRHCLGGINGCIASGSNDNKAARFDTTVALNNSRLNEAL
jgi:hypothetical protein